MHIRRKAEASVAKRRRTRIISVLLGVGGPFLEDPFILTMVVWFYGFYNMDGVLLSSSLALSFRAAIGLPFCIVSWHNNIGCVAA